ncbi:TetR/AcrR family transcriptional regulator [Parabacteroides segnis]|jgi:TetR/AcrR family transcriptional regulator|uniref:TetR/AcrR family transcriptional regulator n=1 Tax=Parabacteroides segnis TaxID=2763058 RepID=A0ABR7E7S9_9BACT|nr:MULTISPECIES: TetR/AcrR family transcriptional regulator [Parabacteroides]MBC5645253.1 TetR/AcrR family transcriptional regulator [Parabacteroides segnis]MCM0715073.1 TetR/AcrR family transcriptional regulator [Parabacteroides sp. TA-V-105]
MVKKNSKSDASERILHTARKLFIKNGYTGTSIRDIAKASGTNIAYVNYYFESKYNLFEIIFDEAFDILINRVFATLNSDMPFFEMVESWISTYYEILPEYPQIPIFILNEVNQNPDALIKRVLKRNPQAIFTRLSQRVEEEVKKGTIKDIPVIDLGLNVLSLCVFPFMFRGLAVKVAKKSVTEYNNVLAEHKKYVIELILNGLKP